MKTTFEPIMAYNWTTSVCGKNNFVTIFETVRIKTSYNEGIKYSFNEGQSVLQKYELEFKSTPQSYEFLYEEIDRRVKTQDYKYFMIVFTNGISLIVTSSEELKKLLS